MGTCHLIFIGSLLSLCVSTGVAFQWPDNAENWLPAFGRKTEIGTFYDSTRARFTALNLLNWEEPIPPSLFTKTYLSSSWHSTSEIITSPLDTLKYFEPSPQFQIDFLCGLTQMGGPWSKFPRVLGSTGHFVRDRVMLTRKYYEECLSFHDLGLLRTVLNRPNFESVDQPESDPWYTRRLPPDVVVNTTYGVSIGVTLTRVLGEKETQRDVERELTQQMCVVNPLCTPVNFTRQSAFNIEIECEFEGGAANFSNIWEARQFIREKMDSTQNPVVPIGYSLAPTATIFSKLGLENEGKIRKVTQIPLTVLRSGIAMFESLTTLHGKIIELVRDAEEVKNCLKDELHHQLLNLQGNSSALYTKYKERLRLFVVGARRGMFPPEAIMVFIKNFKHKKFNALRAALVVAKNQPVETYKLLTRQGVQCIDKRWPTLPVEVDGELTTTYILLGNGAKKDTEFLKRAVDLVKLAKEKGTKSWVGEFEDCKWDFCGELKRRRRTTLIKFFRGNLVSTNVTGDQLN